MPVEALDGWTIAVNLTRSGCRLNDVGLRVYAERLATRAVLARAARLVGPLRGATVQVREPLAEPWAGELDVEATLENLAGKPFPEAHDWVGVHREERRQQVVLMVDTSLSMAGEKMALAAVAAAVLALRSHPGDLSVVLFADEARIASRLDEATGPEETVRRMLARPCGGATNIAGGLRRGRAELSRSRDPRRSALLITDGMFTAGPDPCAEAERFADLHVLLIREHEQAGGAWITPRRLVGAALARAAHGHVARVDCFAQLPRRMVEVADRLLH